jgi:cell division protein FtsI/penicillin-binding protein 2
MNANATANPDGENIWRYKLLGIFFVALAVLIVVQVIRIQFGTDAKVLRENGNSLGTEIRTISAARGQIYDRWGHILAGNTTVYELGADLQNVRNPETIALTLVGVLHSNYADVFAAASKKYSGDSNNPVMYAPLADYVTPEQKDAIQKISADLESQNPAPDKNGKVPSLNGIVFTPHLMRSYPEKDLASNVLGFVNRQGEGFFGVEEKFNDLLAGTSVKVETSLDPNQVGETPKVPKGASLVLTIDRQIQASMEAVLDKGVKNSGADGGALLVMDPRTGEILAMAVTPRLDLNQYWKYSDIYPGSTPFNRAVSQAYETGSVYKVLTMAAALDNGTVTPDTPFLDTGVFEIGGIEIHNWDNAAWGPQTMLGCMEHSLNVCLAWVASQLGPTSFYKYMQAFGIGHLTGIDLGGEVPGRLKHPGDADWYDADLGTNAFGQGVSATTVQMLMAISAIANDGKMVTPHVVRSLIDNGRQYNTPIQIAGMPISAETAHTESEMLAQSLELESSNALVDGYRVSGKTGTAEIPTPYGYTSGMTNASFVGWGPTDDPKFLVYVWLEKPRTSIWGSIVASPIFKEAVDQLVILMNIPPDNVRKELTAQ